MKALLITLLVVILAIFGWNKYQDYQRFHPDNYTYTPSENIDANYFDQDVVYAYYDAISHLNGHIATQWSANGIDVRNPKNDDAATLAAVNTLNSFQSKVAYYEQQLVASKNAKAKGLTNTDIQSLKISGKTLQQQQIDKKLQQQKEGITTLFEATPYNELRIGSTGPLVFEIQQLLVNKGYDIPVDGKFQHVTFEAVQGFESEKGLYVDGRLDLLTLEKLLE